MRIGIITIQEPGYHPNRRLLEAARKAGHQGMLIHPYHLWPITAAGRLEVTGTHFAPLPHVVLPRQGAQIGDACLTLIHQFQLMGTPLVNDHQAVSIARNKFLTQQLLTAAGLPCPDAVFVNDESGFFHGVDQLGGYPVVAKQTSGRQGDGVMRITDAGDARQRALPALDRRRGLIVQRYLQVDKRRDLRALVIGGEVVCAASLIPSTGEFRSNFHLGGNIEATALTGEIETIAVGAATTVGCDVAGVDMIVDKDDRPFIVEVNCAPGFKGLEAATGLDIAGRIIQFAADRYRHHRESITV
ncbi:MAG: RimK family alpha-L-glutamate ligase [Desulfosarcina sp.]|nr:RimK family alpha-L-glutamate ligase [Desulfosarcina sp.]